MTATEESEIMSSSSDTPLSLEQCQISSLAPSFYYIPNFITSEEEALTVSKIPPNKWTQLSHRRLQTHPRPLTPQNVLLASPLPPWLSEPIMSRFKELGIFDHTPHKAPNHVLVNEYVPGEGIMPHEDGAAYADVVATVSLGSTLCLELFEKRMGDQKEGQDFGKPIARILQEPGSLLVTTGEAYRCLLHGIMPVHQDVDLSKETIANWELLGNRDDFDGDVNKRGTRISLTYRDVLKVSDVGRKILGLGRR